MLVDEGPGYFDNIEAKSVAKHTAFTQSCISTCCLSHVTLLLTPGAAAASRVVAGWLAWLAMCLPCCWPCFT
jgi:hypothetical protein